MQSIQDELAQLNESLQTFTKESKDLNSRQVDKIGKITNDYKNFDKDENQKSNVQLVELNKTLFQINRSIDTKSDDCQVISARLNKTLVHQVEQQKEYTSTLSNAISTIPNGSYPLALTSGVIGALVASFAAFLITFLYQKYLNNLNKKSHFADISISILDSFQNTASNYWVKDKVTDKRRSNNNDEEMKVLEIRIKTEFTVLKASLNEFKETLTDKDDAHKQKIKNFINDIYDLATGGDFESENKKSEITTAAKICKQSANMKSILLKYSQRRG